MQKIKLLLRTSLLFLLVISTLFIAFENLTWAAPPAAFTLKVSVLWGPTNVYLADAVRWYGEQLSQRTGGRVKCEYFWQSSLAAPKDYLKATRSGITDMAYHVTAYDPASTPLMTVGSLPCIFTNNWAGLKTMEHLSEIAAVKSKLDENNVVFLASWSTFPYVLYTSKKAVRKLDDFKGLRVRCIGEQADLFRELGSVPVGIAVAESYEALQRGTIDGANAPLSTIESYKHAEVCRFLTKVPIGGSLQMLIINKGVYNKLGKDVHKIMQDIREKHAAEWVNRYSAGDLDLLNNILPKRYNWEIISLPDQDWQAIIKKAAVWWQKWAKDTDAKKLPGTETLNEFVKVYEKYVKETPPGLKLNELH